jgi:predicted dehydrogenase
MGASKALNVGIIGAGVFGGHHAAKAAASPLAQLVGVFDPNPERAEAVASRHGAEALADVDALLRRVDAVVIATPAVTHEALVARALRAGRHVLVEKPLALSTAGARKLVRIAEEAGLVLQVGHQERLVLQAMGVWSLAEPVRSVSAVRAGPPSGRALDVSVVYDLMIHDLDLAAQMARGASVVSVSATGRGSPEAFDHVEALVRFSNGMEANLVASRIAEARERRLDLTLRSGAISVDFLARKVDNATHHSVRVDVSNDLPDPLGAADVAFFAAVLNGAASPVPGASTIRAVALAEAVESAARRSRLSATAEAGRTGVVLHADAR